MNFYEHILSRLEENECLTLILKNDRFGDANSLEKYQMRHSLIFNVFPHELERFINTAKLMNCSIKTYAQILDVFEWYKNSELDTRQKLSLYFLLHGKR